MTGVERFYLTDASGSAPQVVDTGCVSPCRAEDDAVFSADGRRILFVRTKSVPVSPTASPDPVTGKPAEGTEVRVLASIEIATGRVTELGDFDECGQCGSGSPRSYPSWSPDRTHIVFTEAALLVGPQPPADPAVFVADADGRNVHQVSEIGQGPAWAPDGTRILFQGIRYSWTGTWFPGLVVRSSSDIYTVRPDGTDLRQLTTDGVSYGPAWSAAGRIWFIRPTVVDGIVQDDGTVQYWVMDADGSHATQLSGRSPEQAWLLQPTP
jgi:Tol biopolymer transport system component